MSVCCSYVYDTLAGSHWWKTGPVSLQVSCASHPERRADSHPAAVRGPIPVRRQGSMATDFGIMGLLLASGAAGFITESPQVTFAAFFGGVVVYLLLTLPQWIKEQRESYVRAP